MVSNCACSMVHADDCAWADWVLMHKQAGKLEGSKGREARMASLRELAAQEDERAVLAGVRLELESLRIMCDRVSRRERLKRECEPPLLTLAALASCWRNEFKPRCASRISVPCLKEIEKRT